MLKIFAISVFKVLLVETRLIIDPTGISSYLFKHIRLFNMVFNAYDIKLCHAWLFTSCKFEMKISILILLNPCLRVVNFVTVSLSLEFLPSLKTFLVHCKKLPCKSTLK